MSGLELVTFFVVMVAAPLALLVSGLGEMRLRLDAEAPPAPLAPPEVIPNYDNRASLLQLLSADSEVTDAIRQTVAVELATALHVRRHIGSALPNLGVSVNRIESARIVKADPSPWKYEIHYPAVLESSKVVVASGGVPDVAPPEIQESLRQTEQLRQLY